jgi:hypothetical protein
MNLSPCSPPQSEDGRVTLSERDCARRVSRSKLARSGALGLFRTPLTGRTMLRPVCDTAAVLRRSLLLPFN